MSTEGLGAQKAKILSTLKNGHLRKTAVKFSFSEKATKIWFWRLSKFLWPSQKSWTLWFDMAFIIIFSLAGSLISRWVGPRQCSTWRACPKLSGEFSATIGSQSVRIRWFSHQKQVGRDHSQHKGKTEIIQTELWSFKLNCAIFCGSLRKWKIKKQ